MDNGTKISNNVQQVKQNGHNDLAIQTEKMIDMNMHDKTASITQPVDRNNKPKMSNQTFIGKIRQFLTRKKNASSSLRKGSDTNKESERTIVIQDIIAPSYIEVDFNHIQVGNRFYRTLFISKYPRVIRRSNWLSPLINFEHSLIISTFYYPLNMEEVLQKLKRKMSELGATLMTQLEGGKILDPRAKNALRDAQRLQDAIASGAEKFFQFGLYVTIEAPSLKELDKVTKDVVSTVGAIDMKAAPATLKCEQGFQSTLPYGIDKLFLVRNLDTTSIATTFPFVSSELTMNKGVLYGINSHNKSLIIFDRFGLENANSVVFAKSGAGKSYSVKLEIYRSLIMGVNVIVIDPEREYDRLCKKLGGLYISFGQDKDSYKINPFELVGGDDSVDYLREKISSLQTFFGIMFGGLTGIEKAILDKAIMLAYNEKGITTDPSTQKRPVPLLEDLYKVLKGFVEPEAAKMARQLERFLIGSAAGIFNQASNVSLNNSFIVFSVRDLQEELRPLAMYLMLDFIWTKVRRERKKRILIVEEAWYMMQRRDSAEFMYSIAKRARKYWLGLTTISQDVDDFLSTDYGRAIINNSALQVLFRQSKAAIDRIQAVFKLSQGERDFLLRAPRGEGLFFAGNNHVGIHVVSSLAEHMLITTDPSEVNAIKAGKVNISDKSLLSSVYQMGMLEKLIEMSNG